MSPAKCWPFSTRLQWVNPVFLCFLVAVHTTWVCYSIQPPGTTLRSSTFAWRSSAIFLYRWDEKYLNESLPIGLTCLSWLDLVEDIKPFCWQKFTEYPELYSRYKSHLDLDLPHVKIALRPFGRTTLNIFISMNLLLFGDFANGKHEPGLNIEANTYAYIFMITYLHCSFQYPSCPPEMVIKNPRGLADEHICR